MGIRIVIVVLVVMLAVPPTTHAYGLLRWTFDAIANQLGLDRGPIPKDMPKGPNPQCAPTHPTERQPDSPRLYIQAEGF